ncbi:hypothetical protein PGB90_010402 [Kerria lacca]
MEDFVKSKPLWKRPSTVPFPNVWHRFQVQKKDGLIYKVKIQEINPDRFAEIQEFMETYFDKDEPLSNATKVLDDEISMIKKRAHRCNILNENISIMATFDIDDMKPEILGVLLLQVYVKNEPKLKIQPGVAWKKALDILSKVEENVDIYQEIASDRYFDFMIAIGSKYRGLNLCFHLLECLPKIGKSFGISGAMSVFTNFRSQKAAKKAGFILYNEIQYKDYKDENGKVIFPITETKSIQCMIKKFTP